MSKILATHAHHRQAVNLDGHWWLTLQTLLPDIVDATAQILTNLHPKHVLKLCRFQRKLLKAGGATKVGMGRSTEAQLLPSAPVTPLFCMKIVLAENTTLVLTFRSCTGIMTGLPSVRDGEQTLHTPPALPARKVLPLLCSLEGVFHDIKSLSPLSLIRRF